MDFNECKYNKSKTNQKMPHQSFNKGGQMRTIECNCGFSIKGHPTELNLRIRLHKKKCVNGDTNSVPLPFNSALGDINGWKGLGKKGQSIADGDKLCEVMSDGSVSYEYKKEYDKK